MLTFNHSVVKKINYVNGIMPELFFGDYMIHPDHLNSRYEVLLMGDNKIEIQFYNHINASAYSFVIDFNNEFTDDGVDENGDLYHHIMGHVMVFFNPGH